MNYIVMECYPSFVILLDENGRFVKAANLHYQVGDTVTDPVLMRDKPQPRRRPVSRWAYVAGALAACLTLVLGILFYQSYFSPVSSIVLRINPEVQLDLNRHGRVVALAGLNDDGAALLDGYDGRGKDSLTVADELIDRAIDKGYLSAGGKVTFSIDAPDDVRFASYGTTLRQGVTDYLDGRMSVIIEIYDSHTVISDGGDEDTDDDDDDEDDDEDGEDDD